LPLLKFEPSYLNMTLFRGHKLVFQQDSRPGRKNKIPQEWLRWNSLVFIIAKNWLSGNADLKPLDNKLWAVLEEMVCRKFHNSLDNLRESLVKVSVETGRAATADWPERLKTFVET